MQHLCVGLEVHRGGGFVHDDDAALAQESARESQQLALTGLRNMPSDVKDGSHGRAKRIQTHREVVAAGAHLRVERDTHPARAHLLRRQTRRHLHCRAALARLGRRAVSELRRRVARSPFARRGGEDAPVTRLGGHGRRVGRRHARGGRRAGRNRRGRRSRPGGRVDQADAVQHFEGSRVRVLAEGVEVGADSTGEEHYGAREVGERVCEQEERGQGRTSLLRNERNGRAQVVQTDCRDVDAVDAMIDLQGQRKLERKSC